MNYIYSDRVSIFSINSKWTPECLILQADIRIKILSIIQQRSGRTKNSQKDSSVHFQRYNHIKTMFLWFWHSYFFVDHSDQDQERRCLRIEKWFKYSLSTSFPQASSLQTRLLSSSCLKNSQELTIKFSCSWYKSTLYISKWLVY